MSALSTAAAGIITALASLPADASSIDENERVAALAACERLRAVLQSPRDAAFEIAFVTHKIAAVQIGMGMGIFNAMAAANGAAVTADDLSEKMGIDANMIVRVMRILVAMRIFEETEGQRTYKSLPLANAFVDGSPWADAMTHLGSHQPAIVALPAYLESTHYATPNDAFHGPWQYALHTDQHYFSWLSQRPRLLRAFNSVMSFRRSGPPGTEWYDFYPAATKLHVSSPSDVLLVDIGGGTGADLIGFHNRHESLPGKLILQDIPPVIDAIESAALPARIEAQEHDFFTPQPVRGAKAYYLRTVLHDWPDKQAHEILRHVREAMVGEESVLLVNETCLAEKGVGLMEAELDMSMMVLFASLERTEAQWRELLEGAGFRVLGVWRPESGSGALFEAVVA